MAKRSTRGGQSGSSEPPAIALKPLARTLFVGESASGPEDLVSVGSFDRFQALESALEPCSPLAGAIRLFFENGGREALALCVKPVAATPGSALTQTLQAGGTIHSLLERTERFDLLCIPNLASTSAIGSMLDLCQARDAMLLIDAPTAWLSARAVPRELANRPSAQAAAAYRPPLLSANRESLPVSGAIAGLFARSDESRGVWRSPAGLDLPLHGAQGLAEHTDQSTAERMLAMGVNPIIDFQHPVGRVVWGARTLASAGAGPEEHSYIAVRRFITAISQAVCTGLDWVQSRPNTAELQKEVVETVTRFLQDLYRQGAFGGSQPRDAYFVECSARDNTSEASSAGILRLQLGIAPLKPAQFLVRDLAIPALPERS